MYTFKVPVKPNTVEEPPQQKPAEPIYPALIDCDKPLDSLIHVVYGGAWYISYKTRFESMQSIFRFVFLVLQMP